MVEILSSIGIITFTVLVILVIVVVASLLLASDQDEDEALNEQWNASMSTKTVEPGRVLLLVTPEKEESIVVATDIAMGLEVSSKEYFVTAISELAAQTWDIFENGLDDVEQNENSDKLVEFPSRRSV